MGRLLFIAVYLTSALILLPTSALADPVTDAMSAAQIQPSDTLDAKLSKTLLLLNDQHYFYPKGPLPILKAPFDQPYHLDSLRSADEILTQKVGGYCGSAGIVSAAVLMKAGVKAEDIRIVGSVINDDYRVICPSKGKRRVAKPRTGASGHIFLMVRFEDGNWYLINTTESSQRYTKVQVPSPEVLQKQMTGQSVAVPKAAYTQLLESPRVGKLYEAGMTVFRVWKPAEYPKHTFDQRLNLIASGAVGGKVCRYDPKALGAEDDVTEVAEEPSPLTGTAK